MKPIRHAGAVESTTNASSYVDVSGAYMDLDAGATFAQFGAKGAGSIGLKLRTILAGVALTFMTATSAGAVTFAENVSMTSGKTLAAQALTATTYVGSSTMSVAGVLTHSGGSELKFNAAASGTHGSAQVFRWYKSDGTTIKGGMGYFSNDVLVLTLGSRIAGGNTVITTGNSATALTFDAGNTVATFAAGLSVTGTATFQNGLNLGVTGTNGIVSFSGSNMVVRSAATGELYLESDNGAKRITLATSGITSFPGAVTATDNYSAVKTVAGQWIGLALRNDSADSAANLRINFGNNGSANASTMQIYSSTASKANWFEIVNQFGAPLVLGANGINVFTVDGVLPGVQSEGFLDTYHANAGAGAGYYVRSFTNTTGSTKNTIGTMGILQNATNTRAGYFTLALSPLSGGAPSSVFTQYRNTNLTVNVTPSTIIGAGNTYGGYAHVMGVDPGGRVFSDFIYYALDGVTVLASRSPSGSPAARTYTVNGSGQLVASIASVPSGNYNVTVNNVIFGA